MNELIKSIEDLKELKKNNSIEKIQTNHFDFPKIKNIHEIKFHVSSTEDLSLYFYAKFKYFEEDIYFSYEVLINSDLELDFYFNWNDFYSNKESIEFHYFRKEKPRIQKIEDFQETLHFNKNCFYYNDQYKKLFENELKLLNKVNKLISKFQKNIDFIKNNIESVYYFYINENNYKQNLLNEKAKNIKEIEDSINSKIQDNIKSNFSINKQKLDDFILEKNNCKDLKELRKKEGLLFDFSICYSPLIFECYKNPENVDFFTPVCLTFYSTAKIQLRIENGKINFYINGFKQAKSEVKYIFERQFLFDNKLVKSNDTISLNETEFYFKESNYGYQHCPYKNKEIIDFLIEL